MIVINPSTRQFNIPGADMVFGVESDSRAETKEFQAPRYVGNNLDLAGSFIRINYRNANGEVDSYLVSDVTVDGENVVFTWELTPKVTMYKGQIGFVMCVTGPDTKVKWHTTLGRGQVLEGLEPNVEVIETGTADVVAQLITMVEAQTEAVEAEGDKQIKAVQAAAETAEAAAVAEIEAKGVNVRESIPDDYTALSEAVDTLNRNRGAAIVYEVAGSAVAVNDASDNYLQGLKIFGRSTQDGTPTPDAPVEIVSVESPVVTVAGKNLFNPDIIATFTKSGATVTNNGDGSFTISGSGETTAYMNIYHQFDHKTTLRMIHSGLLSISESPHTYPYFYAQISYNNGDSRWTISNAATNSVPSKEIPESILTDETAMLRFGFYAEAGVVIQTGTIKPMVYQYGDDTFEPYKSIQTVELTHTLPGIPVTSGGNYTDSDGQQWICDEVDLERGVYVQRIGKKTFVGSSSELWSKADADGYYINLPDAMNGTKIYSEKYPYNATAWTTGCVGIAGTKNLWVADTTQATTLITWKEHLAENPLTVMYPLLESIETTLSETEIAAYRALHSNYPNTTVLNDSGAHMVVKYAADTKLYIDNKIAALVGG